MDSYLFIYLIQKITNYVEGTCQDAPLVDGLVGRVYIPLATACTDQVLASLVNSVLHWF